MNTYALIKNGIVDNIIVLAEPSQLPLESGYTLKAAESARIGDPWDNSMIPPPPEPEPATETPVQPTTTGSQTL